MSTNESLSVDEISELREIFNLVDKVRLSITEEEIADHMA